MVPGQLDIYMQKKKKNLDINQTPFKKFNWKCITDRNVKCETIKLLEVNIEENLRDLRYGNDILDTPPKVQPMSLTFKTSALWKTI